MNKKSLLAMSLMGLALVACSEDEQLNGGTTGKVNGVEGELAKVTLNVSVAAPQTKGNPTQIADKTGTEAESKVSSLVVVADYGSGVEIRKITTLTENPDGTYSGDVDLPEGNPTFYVYANTTDITESTTGWSTALVSTSPASSYYTNNSFFMSNVDGEGVVDLIDPNSETNQVDVDIERAAVKISVEVPEDVEEKVSGASGGKLYSLAFAPKSTADKFFLLCQDPQAMPTTDMTYSNTEATEADDLTDVTIGTSLWADDGKTTITTDFNSYVYCLENIQSAVTNATYLNFKTVFTPSQKINLIAATGEGATGLVINDEEDITDVTIDESTTATNAPSFYVVRGVETGYGDYDNHYIMKSDLYQEDGTTFKTGVSLTEIKDDDQKVIIGYNVTGIKGITKLSAEYVNGECWFGPIYIPETGYSIYRNDWYHMVVNSITLPGVPGEPGPGEPDANVKISATVIPWNYVERNLDLHD